MRHTYLKKLAVALALITALPLVSMAQVVIPFTQRTSVLTPSRKIYNLKGDFQMIGNSNLTKSPYSDDGNNTTGMVYVDIDGDATTLNSSSATLQFSAEAGIDHSCTKIVYAGLYWMGRAHDGTSSPESWTIGGGTNDRTNGNSFSGYTLAITSTNDNGLGTDGRVATYTFTPSNGGDAVIFRFYSWRQGQTPQGYTTVQVGSGAATNIDGTISATSSGWSNVTYYYTFTPTSPYVINTGAESITINSLRKNRTSNTINNDFRVSVTSAGKTLNKREVKFKKAGGTYTTVTAKATDILYPTTDYGMMYAAYAEVTNYVKTNGIGEYIVADMALNEGDGGGTGFFGGWSLVVIYENSKMKWRDITMFDGYAYVQGSTTISHTLDVNGFRTAKNGPIRVKMGLMAGEGDRSISGDYFEIKRNDNGNWERLFHSGNSTTNFFNSSIPAINPRNPNRLNNYGLDVAMFEVPNTDNGIIGNNQTSTSFRYGSTQDTYVIPTIVFAVDAYVPDVRAQVSFTSTTQGEPAPGDTVEYKLELSNASAEQIDGVAIDLPIPYTAEFVEANATWDPVMNGQTQQPTFSTTPGNLLHWQVGTLPVAADPNNPPLLATLTFKLRVTEDCGLLIMDDRCIAKVTVNGKISGHGHNSGEDLSNTPFLTGYEEANGGCDRIPLYGPLNIAIKGIQEHCPEGTTTPGIVDNQVFSFCNAMPINIYDSVNKLYPKGCKFYDKVAYSTSTNGEQVVTPTSDAIEYTSANDFPKTPTGTKTYHAVPFGESTCSWSLTLIIEPCAYWVGGTSTDWATASNWSKNAIPAVGDKVEFATQVNNPGHPAQRDLVVDADRTIGGLVNATNFKVVVPPAKSLVVNGLVVGSETTPDKLLIQADAAKANGTFIVNSGVAQTIYATVEMYSKASKVQDANGYVIFTDGDTNSPTYGQKDTITHSWQYFGIPVDTVDLGQIGEGKDIAKSDEAGFWLRQRKEAWNDPYRFYCKWRYMTPSDKMSPFWGYEVTQNAPAKYTFKGRLNLAGRGLELTRSAEKVVAVTATTDDKIVRHELGQHIVANSYTAAMNAGSLTFDDALQKTVYLYNTGHIADWQLNKDNGAAPGGYFAIPTEPATPLWSKSIPSMQGFLVKYTDAETKYAPDDSRNLHFNYEGLVKNADLQRAPAQNSERGGYLRVVVSSENSADAVLLIEKAGTTAGFDNGWDGEKIGMPNTALFLPTEAGDMQIAADKSIVGKYITFKAGKDTEYTLTLTKDNLGNYSDLKLVDLATRTVVALDEEETTYNFNSTLEGRNEKRFLITRGGTETGNAEQDYTLLDAYMADGSTLVVSNLTGETGTITLNDVAGRTLQTSSMKANFSEIDMSGYPTGIYMVTLRAGSHIETIKVVVK